MDDCLTAVYDLAMCPAKYDFLGFLLAAENERGLRGLKSVRFVFLPGPNDGFRDDHMPPRDTAAREQMMRNVVLPMCKLLPSCIGVERRDHRGIGDLDGWITTGASERVYGLKILVQVARNGLYPLRVDGALPGHDNVVTITLRESHYWPTRNSTREVWFEVAERLTDMGLTPLFVPDVDSADTDELKQHGQVDHEATTDLHGRLRLYRSCRHNFFVNNGPAWLATFVPDINMTMCKILAPEAPGTTHGFYANAGLPPGSQLGRPGHRIIWGEETAVLNALDDLAAAA